MVINCKEPTEHYSSGRELLLTWDINKDESLSKSELLASIQAYIDCETPDLGGLCPIPISNEELLFIKKCYENYNGNINAICPPPTSYNFYIIIIAIAVLALLLIFRK